MLALLACALLPGPSVTAAPPQSARLDGHVESGVPLTLELSDEDEVREGHGPIRWYRFQADEAGVFSAFALSDDFDPMLVLTRLDGSPMLEMLDDGESPVPWVKGNIVAEGAVRIGVAAEEPEASGNVVLEVHLMPETDVHREAAQQARAKIAEARGLQRAGRPQEALEVVRGAYEALLAVDGALESNVTVQAVFALALRLGDFGDRETEAEAWRLVIDFKGRTSPPDAHSLNVARGCYSTCLRMLGDYARAREQGERAISAFERRLPPNHGDLARARANHATLLQSTSELERSVEIARAALAGIEPVRPPNDRLVQQVRSILAESLRESGDAAGALAVHERALEILEAGVPEEDPALQACRLATATTLSVLGQLDRARELAEQVLEVYTRNLPPGHGKIASARRLLSHVLYHRGDLTAARALMEEDLATLEASLAPDDANLMAARHNMAMIALQMGELETARAKFEELVETRARLLAPSDRRLLRSRSGLANTLERLGEVEAARGQYVALLETQVEALGADDTETLMTRLSLAKMLERLERFEEARAQMEEVLARKLEQLPEDDQHVQIVRSNLSRVTRRLGDEERARELARDMARCVRSGMERRYLASGRRDVEAEAENLRSVLDELLSGLVDGGRYVDTATCADAVELIRGASLTSQRLVRRLASAHDAGELSELRVDLKAATRRVDKAARDGDRRALIDANLEREALERRLRESLAEHADGVDVLAALSTGELARRLPEDLAAVGYWTFTRRTPDGRQAPHLVAFVHRRGEEPALVELGPYAAVSEAASAWRASIGVQAERGLGVAPAEPPTPPAGSGERLRSLVFDPLTEHLAGADHLAVAAEGALHAVPLDALPLDEGVVGDRYRVHYRPTLLGMLDDAPAPSEERAALLAVGDLDYGETPFANLPATSAEVRAVQASFEAQAAPDDVAVTTFTGEEATRSRLTKAAAEASFLHVATHGILLDTGSTENVTALTGDADLTASLSPLTRCALVLANGELLTGEELAALDLGRCELAVLSACDTARGAERTGQGIASLQLALHLAGARTAVTSVWKVPDAATSELMQAFYRELWQEGRAPLEALWRAKTDLRKAGAPRSAWAGWVLTGAP